MTPRARMTGIRHAWTFDDMFSTYATQGLEAKEKGMFTREELAAARRSECHLAQGIRLFHARQAERQARPSSASPIDYFLEFKDQLLTLHFTLPLKTPAKAQRPRAGNLRPDLFRRPSAWRKKMPVTLANARRRTASSTVVNPDGNVTTQSKPLSESFFSQLDTSNPFGAQFANKISVKCP